MCASIQLVPLVATKLENDRCTFTRKWKREIIPWHEMKHTNPVSHIFSYLSRDSLVRFRE